MKVVVVGGGITGLFVAYYLADGGHTVTILERGAAEDSAAAYSAGLITPSTGVAPSIGMGAILSSLFGRRSTISVSMLEVFRNLRWFMIASRRGLTGFEEVVGAFGKKSLGLYREFLDAEKVQVDMLEGIAGLYFDPGQARRLAASTGARFMGQDELSAMGFAGIGGGVYEERELSVDPRALTTALQRRVSDLGVQTRRGEPSLRGGPTGSVSISMGGDRLEADHCVVTAGAWSRSICRSLGYDPLLLPARGWSTLFAAEERIIGCPALFEDSGIAAVQHNERLFRLTSFFDLVGFRGDIPDDRRAWMKASAAKHIKKFGKLREVGGGVGFRPCTPDQLPIIGAVPGFVGLHLATGGCRLGVTLAPATAQLIKAEIEGTGGSESEFEVFSPERFEQRP